MSRLLKRVAIGVFVVPIVAAVLNAGPTGQNRATATWRRPGACGLNCLYAMLNWLNRDIDYDDVSEKVKVDPRRGSSLEDLQRAAADMGVDLQSRFVELAEFPKLEPPYIAHIENPDDGGSGHYIVVIYHEPNGCAFMDGTTALEYSSTWSVLEKSLSGYVLTHPRSWSSIFLLASYYSLWAVCAGLGLWILLLARRSYRRK